MFYYNDGLLAPKIFVTATMVGATTVTNTPSLATELIWVGITVPNWVGWIFYGLALLFGSFIGTFQESYVDRFIQHRELKPIYSFGFGLFFTLFGIPLYWEGITIWQLILPAVASAAIGSQMVYYLISSGKYILDSVFKKFGLEPLPDPTEKKQDDRNSG